MKPRVLMSSMAFALAMVVAHHRASAICGREADSVTVPPPLGVRAPLNVRPRVTLHADWRTKSFCPSWGMDKLCLAGHFLLELRVAGSGGGRDDVIATELRESTSGAIATVEMIPHNPLAANTRFEIVYREQNAKEAARIVATFLTGYKSDHTPPQWDGVDRYRTVNLDVKGHPSISAMDDMMCSGIGMTLIGKWPASDEGGTREEDLRYALWMAEPTAVIDYAVAPRAYLSGATQKAAKTQSFEIAFGTRPPPAEFEFPAGKHVMKLGLRAVDLAGNVSPASEIVVTKP